MEISDCNFECIVAFGSISKRSATTSSRVHPTGICAPPRHLSPQNLGKLYLTHKDKCVHGAQYKLFGTMGLNLGHVGSKLGHRLGAKVVAEVVAAVVAEEVAVVAEGVAEVVAEVAEVVLQKWWQR